MNALKPMQVKFLGAREQMDQLHDFTKQFPADIRVQSYGDEKDPTNLRFGIAEVATLVAIIQGTLTIPVLAKKLYDLLKPTAGRRIVIQTPTRRIELISTDGLTPAEVENAMRPLFETVK